MGIRYDGLHCLLRYLDPGFGQNLNVLEFENKNSRPCLNILEFVKKYILALVYGYLLKLFDIQNGHFVELILHVHIYLTKLFEIH
jgi:hypothetical protein